MSTKLIVRIRALLLALAIIVAGAGVYALTYSRSAAPARALAVSVTPTVVAATAIQLSPAPATLVAPATEYLLPTPAPQPGLVGDVWARTELYFGTNKPKGKVSDRDFENFVDSVVTPRFPDGLTLLTGYGQFRNSKGVIEEERSHVLILLYPLDDPEANAEIEYIRDKYKRRFDQESVLRVDSLAQVSF
jgi:hypothetical protein